VFERIASPGWLRPTFHDDGIRDEPQGESEDTNVQKCLCAHHQHK